MLTNDCSTPLLHAFITSVMSAAEHVLLLLSLPIFAQRSAVSKGPCHSHPYKTQYNACAALSRFDAPTPWPLCLATRITFSVPFITKRFTSLQSKPCQGGAGPYSPQQPRRIHSGARLRRGTTARREPLIISNMPQDLAVL